jgi:hypothetical protein
MNGFSPADLLIAYSLVGEFKATFLQDISTRPRFRKFSQPLVRPPISCQSPNRHGQRTRRIKEKVWTVLPLLGGEGRGEGELFPIRPSTINTQTLNYFERWGRAPARPPKFKTIRTRKIFHAFAHNIASSPKPVIIA